MSKNNKALFFVNSLKSGGAEKVVLTLAEELYAKNIKSVVVSLYEDSPSYVPNYIENFCLKLSKSNSNLSSLKKMLFVNFYLPNNNVWKKFISIYQDFDFCLITAHLPLSHKVAMCSPFKNRCIYVMHVSLQIVPSWFDFFHKKILKKSYQDLKISCVSEGVSLEFKNIFRNQEIKIATIYSPVKVERINNVKVLHNRPFIIMIGRLCKQKNQIKFIEIYNNLKLSDYWDLLIIGNGPEKKKLQECIEEFNLNNHIQILNYQENIYDWIEQSSFLVSTSNFEGLGLTLIEALMLNKPVISTDCKYGPSEVLINELKNFLIPINADDTLWMNKIKIILDDKYPIVNQAYFKKFSSSYILKQYFDFFCS